MTTRIAVAGAGMIGRRHMQGLAIAEGVELCAVADPSAAGRAEAERAGVPYYATVDAMIAAGDAQGIVLALPNQLHASEAAKCIAAGVPILVEKPLTATVAEGVALVAAAEQAGVPVLTGHHRRHNDLVRKAHEVITNGQLGTLTTVQGQVWFMKPDHYFDVDWRTRKGAGPVYLNLIHDIDLLHCFCGPIASVHAMESNAVRGNEVEETAVILLRFESGLLGTMNVCDAAVAPWSWELTAHENPDYPATNENTLWIGGTKGSLSVPNLTLRQNHGKSGWWEPISATRQMVSFEAPLVRQMAHFGRVIRGEEQPIVTGADGLAALRVIEAIKMSAASGQTVHVADL